MTRSFEQLIEIMRTAPNPNDRIKAIRFLCENRDKRGIEPLIILLRTEKHLDTRIWGTRALGLLRGQKGIPLLKEISLDIQADNALRKEAIHSLGLIANAKAVTALKKLLQKEPPIKKSLRKKAIIELFQIGTEKGLAFLFQLMKSERNKRIRKLIYNKFKKLAKMYQYKSVESFYDDFVAGRVSSTKKIPLLQFEKKKDE